MAKPDYSKLFQIAESQGGYFTSKQAAKAGYYRQRLYDLAKKDQFIRAARGIYRLAHFPVSRYEDLHVASLRTGPDSVVSHESALAVYDLSDVLPVETHIIIPRTGSRRRKVSPLTIQEWILKLLLAAAYMERGLSFTLTGGLVGAATPARPLGDAAYDTTEMQVWLVENTSWEYVLHTSPQIYVTTQQGEHAIRDVELQRNQVRYLAQVGLRKIKQSISI